MTDNDLDDSYRVSRRRTLAALGAGAGTVVGIGGFSGTAVAWEQFDVEFKGCSEVWMIVGEDDITFDPPAVAHVIVESDGLAVCHTVEFTEENATLIPGQFGDMPVVKFAPGGDDKVLGVLEYNYTSNMEERFDRPVWCVHENTNNCASTPNTRDVHAAPCVPDDHPVCPDDETDGGPGNGGNGGNGNGGNSGNGNGGNSNIGFFGGPRRGLRGLF